MRRSKFLIFALVLIMVMAGALPLTAPVSAEMDPHFISASSSCEQGFFSFINVAPQINPNGALQDAWMGVMVTATDSVGTPLGSANFTVDPYVEATYTGTIDYLATPEETVTFELYYNYEGYYLVDTITVPAICGLGCDALINIPAQAVSGLFVSDALVYWGPDLGKQINDIVVTAGKTYLVFGQDATGQFRQILLGCSVVWVPFNTVGPNPDAVWNNTPLPTTVVK